MFKKILVANRGEIACRVFKTAKRMGIATVAVYSEADRNALHVEMADEAVFIGPPAAAESYLVIDRIVEACKQTGAEAVHPGYGFLSERAEFAERLAAEGIAFIGPPRGAIEAMGDKITSKKIAAEAGVSTVPGVMGLIDDAEHAVRIATDIGYPVMIKASAGGGGKGMRIAWNDEEAREGFERSKSEAASSFGDDRIFIEKFVTEPRHIEIQVLADTKGNCIYLGERECSIQRRNQKVIEEAPSPFLDAETRKAMGEQAVALAKAVDYASAGTVEFIVDKDRNFYFLEMNTRLQVEHPVTELITGVDLVEQMIRVASGEELGIGQDDIKLNGWAVESRLYAEDPYRNFLPSIGRLTRYRPPQEGTGENGHIVRNDTGVFEGGEISMFYDPMIAKLCTWAPDRSGAVESMADALDHFEVEGIGHNIPFLSAVMDHGRFRSGDITTAFIAEEYPDGFVGVEADSQTARDLSAVAAVLDAIEGERRDVTASKRFSDNGGPDAGEKTVRMDRENTKVRVSRDDDGYSVTVGEKEPMRLTTSWQPGETLALLEIDGASAAFKVDPAPGGYRLRHRGIDQTVQVLSTRVAELAALMPEKLPPDTSKMLLCPMPGLVVALHVEEGAEVEEGQSLAIVEAMKMENVLRAERPGKVAKIPVSVGDSLAVDEVIMEFEA
ncbi:acetyl-CoA carboxylase biotin carboxylase subunit [Hoeflea poritis]|uniref:propionyl-CoA carboxylase n=1 Tax=Hoeflea poritis TaxID=2993659 RepID=A0ABT4VIG2_9HYPH|nr:acetyl/propionyl/methylcrotonyl-CoA carboxylase subunit alpha [Hoeflea poritis]MDA4844499.1 acetyl/propionyl/methylcrotonyl-CoA carboxylase subunit alpha [Hoeflea poritis]